MIAFVSIVLPVAVILFILYFMKLGERMERERKQREVAEALLDQKKKDEETKANLDIELNSKRKSIRELLQNIHSSD